MLTGQTINISFSDQHQRNLKYTEIEDVTKNLKDLELKLEAEADAKSKLQSRIDELVKDVQEARHAKGESNPIMLKVSPIQ